MSNETKIDTTSPIIFFDGVCNLCNHAVDFILRYDKSQRYKFASLQSDKAKDILHGRSDLQSIILLEDGIIYQKSRAAMKIARGLSGWPYLFSLFRFVPLFISDFVYDVIAKYRYRWFGKSDTCRIPTAEEEARFV